MSRFSLLDDLANELQIPAVEAFEEDLEDAELESEEAIESEIDSELSEADIKAILDDTSDDSEAVDIEDDEEDVQAIADDTLDEDLKTLESLLESLEL